MFLTSSFIDQAITLIEGFECYGDLQQSSPHRGDTRKPSIQMAVATKARKSSDPPATNR